MTLQAKHINSPKDLQATEDGHLITQAIVQEEIEHAAVKGNAFAFFVTSAAIDTTDTVLFVRNDDDALFLCDRATLYADAAETMTWQIALGTATTTPSGGALTPTNLYQTFSGKTFSHISLTDETAVAQGTIIETHVMLLNAVQLSVPLHGIVLGKGQYIQFDVTGTTPIVGMTLWGHWEAD